MNLKSLKCLQLSLVISALVVVGCAARGPSGAFDEWVSGAGVSVRVTVASVAGRELPTIDLDNQSDAGISIVPLKCTGWYKASGKYEITWEEDKRNLMVAAGQRLTGFFTVNLDPPEGDVLEKIRLVYGSRSLRGRNIRSEKMTQ